MLLRFEQQKARTVMSSSCVLVCFKRRPCRRKKSKRFTDPTVAGKACWSFLLRRSFLLTVIALAIAATAITPKSSARHQLGLEERIEAEQRLSDLGYWNAPVGGVLDLRFRQTGHRSEKEAFTACAVESGAGSLSAVHRVDLADRRFNALSRVA